MSQDTLCMYDHLVELCQDFETPSAVQFFRSPGARESQSRARNLVEAGQGWIRELKEEDAARVLFAAIVLGGATLSHYLKAMEGIEKKKFDATAKKLRELLRYELYFDELYSKWLSENLHRLKESSVALLEPLEPDSYQYVRVSTIAQFDYEKQLVLFKSRARNIYSGFQSDKLAMLEAAITLTNDRGVVLDLATLGKVIMCARDLPKQSRGAQSRFKEITLDKWLDEVKKEQQQMVIEDKNDIVDAFNSIAVRHKDLLGKEELVQLHGRPVRNVFAEAKVELSHLQLATATLAFLNCEKVQAQIWVVPAGQGKSRIHAALTFLFLEHTDYDIYVVFQNEGLMKIDRERNRNL